MVLYILRRILYLIPILICVIILVFTINWFTPADPIDSILTPDSSEELKEQTRKDLGLDQPYHIQLFNYFKNIITRFDFGNSYRTKTSVSSNVLSRVPVTLKLGWSSVFLAALIGLPLGIVSATHQNSVIDYISTFFSIVGASVPGFWVGIMLILLFALNLGLLPPSGTGTFAHWILPVVSLSLYPIALFTRMTRSSMLEVVRQDYIRTARSKGIDEKRVIWVHALKNALLPIVTVIGLQLSFVIAGTLVIEAVFNLPGMGNLLKTAVGSKDNPTILGCVIITALLMSIINLLVDVLYAFIDPRVKTQYAKSGRRKKKASEKEG